MENEFLTFEATDVELIGDVIEFDEEVQRGEKVRFYTLNEQVTDAFEHMIPKGRTTRAQLDKIDKEVDRIRDLYETYVSPTTEGYDVRVPQSLRSFSWIRPVYVSSDVSEYAYDSEWIPLFSTDAIRQPNGYTRMLTALPSPYPAQEQGTPYPLDAATEFVDMTGKTPIRVLPQFVMNKTRHHEDGRIGVLSVPVDGTADNASFHGYWLKKRTLPIPDPLPEHPFLASNEARFIETNQPLSDVIPELESVMAHGVPVTQDPYGEGKKYLKIYDISLDAIPWSLWKQRFPKKELVDTMPPPIELPFKEGTNPPPSSNISEQYGDKYFPGLSARKWLMGQEDGGRLVVKMIHSLSGNAGTVDMLPISELGDIRFPDVEEDQCRLTGLTFHDFAVQGVIRQLKDGVRKCFPLDIIKQERHQIGYRNRIQWKESTPKDILLEYTRALTASRRVKSMAPLVTYEKHAVRSSSKLHEQVIAILKDDARFPEDKLTAITLLTRDSPRSNQVVIDQEGLFVVCEHTLAILGGDMAKDRLAFYDTWTARDGGSRVCTVCGEEINRDVLVHQEDFSEEGRALKHGEALEQQSFHGEETMSFTTKLRSLQESFDMGEPADGTLFLLISLLQLLPSQEQLLPVLQEARGLANALKPKDRDGKARGMVGIAATALLLQTHIPRLVPRRSFGSLPLKIDGFPRDTDSDKAPTVIDGLMTVLRKTFEAYPTSFKGPSVAVMRAVLSESANTRKGVIAIIKRLMPTFASAMKRAKSENTLHPSPPPPVGLVPVILPPEKLGAVNSFPPCGNPRTVWASNVLPKIRQPSVPLDRVRPHPSAQPIQIVNPIPHAMVPTDTKEIQRRIKLPAASKIAGDSWRTNLLIIERLKNIFELDVDVASIDVTQKPALLRDIAEGMLKEVMGTIMKDPIKRQTFEQAREKDLSLYVLLTEPKDAKTETNKLRALERHVFTDRLREMTDSQRQITKDLLDRGMAPYIITNADRDVFAAQIERELQPIEESEPDVDVGVGAPRDNTNEEDVEADYGDYGDYSAQGNRERELDIQPLDGDGPI